MLHGLHDARDRDAKGPRPTNKRVWAGIEHSAQRVVDNAFSEGLRRDPERALRWVALVDSQCDQIVRVLRGATVGHLSPELDVVAQCSSPTPTW